MCDAAENARMIGYLVVGGVFVLVGAILIGTSFIGRDKTKDVTTIADIRRLYNNDDRLTALYSAGVAVLASGLLVFFGFGITSLVARKAETANTAASAMHMHTGPEPSPPTYRK